MRIAAAASADEVRVAGITAINSAPIGMGQDSNRRHEWSVNFRAHVTGDARNRGA